MPHLSRQQHRQEDQYQFPYHYIPQLNGRSFTQTLSWQWGMRYLGGLEIVLDLVSRRPFRSLIDVGCGDGRFLALLREREKTARLLGVDYSMRAIALARAMSPQIQFECRDIVGDPVADTFDVVTLIEVLEHIETALLPEFVAALRKLMHDESTFVLTVPHRNVPLAKKHVQHFTSADLRTILSPSFSRIDLLPFDTSDLLLKLLDGLTCRSDIIVNWPPLLGFKWRHYTRHCLRDIPENRCFRLAAVCRP